MKIETIITEDWELEALKGSIFSDEEVGELLRPDTESMGGDFDPETEQIKVTLERIPK